MTLQVNIDSNTIYVAGELVGATIERDWPQPPSSTKQVPTIVDLSQLTKIDTFGLAWLIELEAQRQPDSVPMQWHHCPEMVTRLLALYNLSLEQRCLVPTK